MNEDVVFYTKLMKLFLERKISALEFERLFFIDWSNTDIPDHLYDVFDYLCAEVDAFVGDEELLKNHFDPKYDIDENTLRIRVQDALNKIEQLKNSEK